MQSTVETALGEYALAVGPAAVRRLHALHHIYAPAGRRVLRQAGLSPGMKVADFGCGVGATTRSLAELVGPGGSVVGIDASAGQISEAQALCARAGLTQTSFLESSAYDTHLPRNSFDFAYCRFLLLHLSDPAACLQEMRSVLKPGGTLFIEDGDLRTACSLPATALNFFGQLFSRLAPFRGVDYSIANKLFHLMKAAGFPDVNMEIHQPALIRGEGRNLLKWSVEEAGAAFVDAGLVTRDQLKQILLDMQIAIDNPDVLVLAPRMSIMWSVKSNGRNTY